MLWDNFIYSWDKKTYLQMSGGPIDARVTMAASRLVMYNWGLAYTQILIRSILDLRLFGIYVDDVRQVTGLLPRGFRFVLEEKRFVYRGEWKEEDDLEDISDLTRVGRACQVAMNSVNPDLQFTVESDEDFANGRIQTLDFEMKAAEDGNIEHSFFEKPMQTSLVTMERSAMGSQQKHAILSNDLVRRLSMLSESISPEERLSVVDHYTRKLKTSGYNQNQCMELVNSGVRGFMNRKVNREKNGEDFYRSSKKTMGKRNQKKFTEKTTWYRK